jgi:hypothetical protein
LAHRYSRLGGDFNAIPDAPLTQQQRRASRPKPKVPLIRCESGGDRDMHSWQTMASSAVLFLALALAACAGCGAALFRGSRTRTNPIRLRERKLRNRIRLATLAAAVVTTACGGGGGGGLSPSIARTSGTGTGATSSFPPVAAPLSAGVSLDGSFPHSVRSN